MVEVEAPKISEEVEALKINTEVVETTGKAVENSGIMANIHNPRLIIDLMTAVGLDLATKVQPATDVANQTTTLTTLSAKPSMQNVDIVTK